MCCIYSNLSLILFFRLKFMKLSWGSGLRFGDSKTRQSNCESCPKVVPVQNLRIIRETGMPIHWAFCRFILQVMIAHCLNSGFRFIIFCFCSCCSVICICRLRIKVELYLNKYALSYCKWAGETPTQMRFAVPSLSLSHCVTASVTPYGTASWKCFFLTFHYEGKRSPVIPRSNKESKRCIGDHTWCHFSVLLLRNVWKRILEPVRTERIAGTLWGTERDCFHHKNIFYPLNGRKIACPKNKRTMTARKEVD